MTSEYSRFRPHPWHGLSPGPDPPSDLYAFVEITPFDLVKYEVDKISGYLRVDRAQRTSSLPPVLVGRLLHYFATYKLRPESGGSVTVGEPYDRMHAQRVVSSALEDYREAFAVVPASPDVADKDG